MSTIYTPAYYGTFQSSSRTSAEVVVPLIMDWFSPSSVIDLGCGMGEWLRVFQSAGVTDIRGIDGEHIDPRLLAIPSAVFRPHDFAVPYEEPRRYDVAMSVEVAEHLTPEQGAALVRSLTELSDVVLFSAAVPGQGGSHHVNCQWPAYWGRLFAELGYAAIDAIRLRIWNDSRVDWWYRQNMLLYVLKSRVPQWPFLNAHQADEPPALVHPEMLAAILDWGLEAERKYWALWQQAQDGADTPRT